MLVVVGILNVPEPVPEQGVAWVEGDQRVVRRGSCGWMGA